MKWTLWVALAVIVASIAAGITAPRGAGAAWDDDGPDGHSALVARLADQHPVRVIKSSLALLPPEAGPSDALFLFPTHRPATQAEVQRVRDFVRDGGLLILAADGDNADPWAQSLGVQFKGLPALLPPGHAGGCVPTTVADRAAPLRICLPSPTAFPDLDSLTSGDFAFTHISYSEFPVFLDTDQDGELSLGDQGPVTVPLVLEWDFGSRGGRVVTIADADLWRNDMVQDHPANLAWAQSLAQGASTVYMDSTGSQAGFSERVVNPWYRNLAAPGPIGAVALVLLLIATAAGTLMVPRVTTLKPHDPPRHAHDPDVERAAAEVLLHYLRRPTLRHTPQPSSPQPDALATDSQNNP